MTAGLLVDRLELKNETDHPTLNHIVPDCWIYVQEPEVKLGRLQIFNNWSPYLVRDPLHTLWIGLEYFCQEGDALWSMTDEDFLAFAAKELETIQVIRPGAVQEGHVVRMKKPTRLIMAATGIFPGSGRNWTPSPISTAWAGTASTGTTTWTIPCSPPSLPWI